MQERVLRVNKSEITGETGEKAFAGDLLEIEDNHASSRDKKLGFRYFCRFVTHALTLRLRNTCI